MKTSSRVVRLSLTFLISARDSILLKIRFNLATSAFPRITITPPITREYSMPSSSVKALQVELSKEGSTSSTSIESPSPIEAFRVSGVSRTRFFHDQ